MIDRPYCPRSSSGRWVQSSLLSASSIYLLYKSVITDIVKRFAIANTIHQAYPNSPLIITLRNRTKPFLPSSIPQLQLDPFAINLYIFGFEVDPNGCHRDAIE